MNVTKINVPTSAVGDVVLAIVVRIMEQQQYDNVRIIYCSKITDNNTDTEEIMSGIVSIMVAMSLPPFFACISIACPSHADDVMSRSESKIELARQPASVDQNVEECAWDYVERQSADIIPKAASGCGCEGYVCHVQTKKEMVVYRMPNGYPSNLE